MSLRFFFPSGFACNYILVLKSFHSIVRIDILDFSHLGKKSLVQR